jgi:hypothetical protein
MSASAKILAAALMTAALPWLVAPSVAGPLSSPLGLQSAVAPSAETVQYRRGWRGGYYRRGGFVGAGLGLAGAGLGLAGAIVGGAIIGVTHPFGYYRDDGYNPGYAYAPGYAGSNVATYCEQRFRSYDPGSGTYLGFDGLRHPCP